MEFRQRERSHKKKKQIRTFSDLSAQDRVRIANYTAQRTESQNMIFNELSYSKLTAYNGDEIARNFAYNSYAQDISMSYMRFDDNFGSYFDSYLGVEKGFKRMMSSYMSYVPDVQKTLNSYAYFDGFGSYWASIESDDNIVQKIAYFTSNDEDSQVIITKALKVENLTDDFKSNTADFVSKDEPAVNRIYSGIRLSKIDPEFKDEIDTVATDSGDKAGTKSGAIAGDAAGERVANIRYNEAWSRGYNVGESDGYDSGWDSGYDRGHSAGYSSGHTAGYSEGFSAGAASVTPAEPTDPAT